MFIEPSYQNWDPKLVFDDNPVHNAITNNSN